MQAVIAASFALGADALASHRLALWLWGLFVTKTPPLEFITLRQPRLPGVKTHRVSNLPRASWKGVVPVTSPLRALLDTAAIEPELLSEALTRGFASNLFTPKAVAAELDRARTSGKHGVAGLEHALHELGVGRFTPSQLELRARRLFTAAGLPTPSLEVVCGRDGEYRLDFYWAEADLFIEVDGWSTHASPKARRRDHRKQNRVVMGDHWILRYDWYDVVSDRARTSAEILEAYKSRTGLAVS